MATAPEENRPPEGNKVVVYLRVSTDEQAESGVGLDAQRHACAALAGRLGLPIGGTFADEGIGGAVPVERRPGLVTALGTLRAGDVLAVAKRDRIGRDPLVVAMAESLTGRAGARIVSAAGEGTAGDEPSDILMRRIVDGFYEFERLTIKARTKGAMDSLLRNGRKRGTVPYGYKAVEDGTPSRKSGLPARIVEAPEEQEAIDLMVRLDHEGRPLRQIAAELNARGVRTRFGRPWSTSTIYYLILRAGSPGPKPTGA